MTAATPVLTELERAMFDALEGDGRAARLFFERLLESKFFVPERHQDRVLSDSPVYPNDLLNVLGIKAPGRVIVPVFTRSELIEAWCGVSLRHRTIGFPELLKILPDEWWVCLNPGAEVEKEISPWELGLLKGGTGVIDELIEEFNAENAAPTVQIRAPKEGEYGELQRGLSNVAENEKEIARLFILREDGGESRAPIVLIGVECFSSERRVLDRIKGEIEAEAARGLIGGDSARVLVGGKETNNFALTLFSRAEPFFAREAPAPRGLWGKLKGFLPGS
ncbi:MAG: SseB protein N-terminal domain [Pseudomonadota bacterium]|jgi:hypothetical protein